MDRTPCRRLGLSRIYSSASKRSNLQPDRAVESGQSQHNVGRIHTNAECSTPSCSHSTHVSYSTPVQSCVSDTDGSHIKHLAHSVSAESADHPAAENKLYGSSYSCIEEDASCADVMGLTVQGMKRKSEVLREQYDEDKHYASSSEIREPSLKQIKGGSSVTPPTLEDLNCLRKRVALKEKKVKELQLAQLYRKKHDPEKLSQAVQQWLNGCQEALQEVIKLLNARGQPVSMTQLLSQLGIPSDLVHYNVEEQEFD